MSEKIIYNGHSFEVVNAVPCGFEVWNIGSHNMPAGFVPLCRLAAIQPFDGGRNVEIETLKAIRCEGADVIMKAASCGATTPEKAERLIHRYSKNEGKSRSSTLERCKEALPYLKMIPWNK